MEESFLVHLEFGRFTVPAFTREINTREAKLCHFSRSLLSFIALGISSV
jgi:hypothetical protein